MKVVAFHAGDGDCLLLTTSDGKTILIDGGRKGSYEAHTRAEIAKLRANGKQLDVVCVSHIDDDHITGVLRLVEDIVEWRAYPFQQSLEPTTKPPKFAQPPEIGEVWHNGLFVLVGDQLAPQVQQVLATVSTVLIGSADDRLRELATELGDLATGEAASMELSRRISPEQLGIALNRSTNGKLMQRETSGAIKASEILDVGAAKFLLLGPSNDDIAKLRVSWDLWIKKHKKDLRDLQADMLADEQRIGALSPQLVANPIEQGLGDGLKSVTEANLASLMFLVEDNGKTLLLTGDGVSSEIIEGLKRHGKLANKRIHVDILKVQHHGAEANVTQEFCDTVTADHYVFCGNGAHHNPELDVIEGFAEARKTLHPGRKFTFWFTSSSKTPDTSKKLERKKHMLEVEQLVATLRAGNQYLDAVFMDGGQREIT